MPRDSVSDWVLLSNGAPSARLKVSPLGLWLPVSSVTELVLATVGSLKSTTRMRPSLCEWGCQGACQQISISQASQRHVANACVLVLKAPNSIMLCGYNVRGHAPSNRGGFSDSEGDVGPARLAVKRGGGDGGNIFGVVFPSGITVCHRCGVDGQRIAVQEEGVLKETVA